MPNQILVKEVNKIGGPLLVKVEAKFKSGLELKEKANDATVEETKRPARCNSHPETKRGHGLYCSHSLGAC